MNKDSVKVIANKKIFSTKNILQDVDMTKCSLPLIAKCMEIAEESEKLKPRDYNKFSPAQKAAFALSFVLGPLAAVVYFAIENYNQSQKNAIESQTDILLASIKPELDKIMTQSPAKELSNQISR